MSMRLAIISLNTESKNLSKYYNSQAEGLARALARMGHELTVYHPVPELEKLRETVEKDDIKLEYIRCRHIGKHALIDLSMLDESKECYITASDNYLLLGTFYRWCRRRHILCLPYIGVVHSNNSSVLKRKVVDILCNNVKYYKRIPTVVKTPALEKYLRKQGAGQLYCVPVGLDKGLLRQDYELFDISELKKSWNYTDKDRVILFVGRMTEEKQPEKMIDIYEKLYMHDASYRLVMVGQGELLGKVKQRISEKKLENMISIYERVPNDRMWEFYSISECYINLNTHEIFGMAILEAMYYGSVVFALKAPGPELIIKDRISGYLCDSEDELLRMVLEADKCVIGNAAKKHVEENFMWESSAGKLECIIEDILRS